MSGILGQIVKAIAGQLLSNSGKSFSSDKESNDSVAEILNRVTGEAGGKGQGGRGKGQGRGSKGSGCRQT